MYFSRLAARLFGVAVFAAVAGGIIWGLLPSPVSADVRTVRRGHLAVRVRDDGVTRIKERHMVRSPLGGHMARVAIHAGDEVVAATTVITTITPPDPALLDQRAEAEAIARVETAKAVLDLATKALERAKVQVEYTAADLARARELYPSKVVTHEQLDLAERLWHTATKEASEAEEQMHVADHLVSVMKAALVRSRPPQRGDPIVGSADWSLAVTAPINGRVLRVLREGEGLVEAGTELVEVGDPRELEAVVDLVTEDAVRVKPGDRCEITGWGGTKPLSGRVRVIEPRGFTKVSPLGVEEQRVNVVIDLDVPPDIPLALGDDFRLDVAITIDEVHDAVLVPLAAVFNRGGQEVVFVAEHGRARLVPVRIGCRGEREAEVLDGLDEGAQVIAYPSDAITDGRAVAPARRA